MRQALQLDETETAEVVDMIAEGAPAHTTVDEYLAQFNPSRAGNGRSQ